MPYRSTELEPITFFDADKIREPVIDPELRELLERFIFRTGIYESALAQPSGCDEHHQMALPAILMQFGHVDRNVFIQLCALENRASALGHYNGPAKVELHIPRFEHPVKSIRPIYIAYEGEPDAVAGLISRAKNCYELHTSLSTRLSGDVADDPLDGGLGATRPVNGHAALKPEGYGFAGRA
jgi:hypothetical protein